MASTLVLRALLGAGLGLGALDLAWLNLDVMPRLIAPGEAAIPEPTPRLPERVVTAPQPPPEQPSPESPPIEQPAPIAMKTSVYFGTRSVSLDSEARETLEHFVSRAGAAGQFVLEGHADHRGDESTNRELSKHRARAVGAALERLGVAGSRVRIGFVGERAASANDELWRDRRVDIQITGGQR
jgi:outer membrane protein OmpA-like peptidoglycan-associated protein